jgi:delta1-piperideine-2-carboxylate reductase
MQGRNGSRVCACLHLAVANDMNDQIVLSLDQLGGLIESALKRGGMSEANVKPVAETMLSCERDGVRSHGLLRLPGFVRSMQVGWADGQAQPRVIETAPSLCVVDAQNGFAQVCLALVRDQLMDMARVTGTAVLLTRNSHHFAALWPDLEPFADAGFVALTCVNSKKRMAAWGGTKPIIGTNAVAFACPRAGQLPLIWDQSSSVLSQGDVLLAANAGRQVAPGVGCNAEGQPTTSPAAILDGGALLPFGGNKGASIAVMVEILAAALTGAPFGFEDESPGATATTSKGGQFLLLVDPSRAGSRFGERVNMLVGAVLEAGAARLPGDRRYQQRKHSLAAGVRLTESEYARLLDLAGQG